VARTAEAEQRTEAEKQREQRRQISRGPKTVDGTSRWSARASYSTCRVYNRCTDLLEARCFYQKLWEQGPNDPAVSQILQLPICGRGRCYQSQRFGHGPSKEPRTRRPITSRLSAGR
jgi:hypothetical protein